MNSPSVFYFFGWIFVLCLFFPLKPVKCFCLVYSFASVRAASFP